ncbi:MAG: IS110 family transposase [Erysipelotrichaceae bacterium]
MGLDVHTTNYTICIMEPKLFNENIVHYQSTISPNIKSLLKVVSNFKDKMKDDSLDITLGYSLYKDIVNAGYKFVILAPTTMSVEKGGKKLKNDMRDARQIAKCMCDGSYRAVYIPTEEDDAIKEFIRMRDDIKQNLKSIKQQIVALLTRHGFINSDTKWTQKYINWINSIDFGNALLKETLDEYMLEYHHLVERITCFDNRIEEIAYGAKYKDKVEKLECFIGIKTHTALSLIVETGDFLRFAKGNLYGAWLGMTPIQDASGTKDNRYGITKAGNSHLRKLLNESAQCLSKGQAGYKSKDLKRRQSKCSGEVVAYADKANERLRRKYFKMVARMAVARELACFIWGMMTDNIESVVKPQ